MKGKVRSIILRPGHSEIVMPSHEVINPKFILPDQTSTTKYRKITTSQVTN